MPSISLFQYPDTIQSSLSILGLQAAPTSLKELNKRYHMLALQHHPDKVTDSDNSADSTEKFKEINEAHKRVLAYFYPSSHDDTGGYNASAVDDTGYDSILKLFIRSILSKVSASGSGVGAGSASATTDTIQSLIHQIITKGIHSAINVFRSMDKHAILTIYDILSKNQELFGISREIMEELTAIMEERTREDIVIRLNPSLLDMLLDRVFILHECGHQYYIPLWHSELHYKINAAASATATATATASATDGEVIVLCDPELPDNVTIDDNNNIYISLDVNIHELFRDQVVPVYINDETKKHGFVYYLHACDVTLQKDRQHSILLRGSCGGIATMNNNADIYKVNKRANVYANVLLVV
jgi:hypothetical protein